MSRSDSDVSTDSDSDCERKNTDIQLEETVWDIDEVPPVTGVQHHGLSVASQYPSVKKQDTDATINQKNTQRVPLPASAAAQVGSTVINGAPPPFVASFPVHSSQFTKSNSQFTITSNEAKPVHRLPLARNAHRTGVTSSSRHLGGARQKSTFYDQNKLGSQNSSQDRYKSDNEDVGKERKQLNFKGASLRTMPNRNVTGSSARNRGQIGSVPSEAFIGMLQRWSAQKPDMFLVFDVSQHIDGISSWLRRNTVSCEHLKDIILLLYNMLNNCQSQAGSLSLILKSVTETNFFEKHIIEFITELNRKKDENVLEWLLKVIDITEHALEKVEASKTKCTVCLQVLKSVAEQFKIGTGGELTHKIISLLKECEIVPSRNQQLNTYRPRTYVYKIPPKDDDSTPPDNYTTMNIFPDDEELNSSVEPYLRANKTSGVYRDLEHYLDIHVRLLKEDYIEPIRNGIQDYQFYLSNQTYKPKEDNFRFYWNVKIVKMGFKSSEGASHFVSFDKTEFEKMGLVWKNSKRLKFGSLLCFTKDGFQNCIFATVAEQNVENLERGIIEVIFQNHLEEVFTSSENETFIFGETTAYFEAYRHVLEGLIEMRSIPLDSYILYCDPDIHRPLYLHYGIKYDLSCILTQESAPIPVLNLEKWPNARDTCLNEMQLEAVKHGLTKEMAIIQGPPGTGKTYVGLYILRILLNNLKHLDSYSGSPILVVCYTNHALDQFLEGVLQFCSEGIVRVGGRSSSEKLENFNLKNLRKNKKLIGKEGLLVDQQLKWYGAKLRHISRRINRLWQENLRLETTIVPINQLKSEMRSHHYQSLTEERRSLGNTHVLSMWLKASNANMENHLYKAAKRHLGKCIAKGQIGLTTHDSAITNALAAVKLKFLDRVRVYRWWLIKYLEQKESEVQSLVETAVGGQKLETLLEEQTQAKTDILRDSLLLPFMTSGACNVFESVKQCVQDEHKTEDFEDQYIRQWLLGTFKNADEVLDAIEVVENDRAEPKKRQVPIRRTDPTGETDRWEISLDDDSDDLDKQQDDYRDLDSDDTDDEEGSDAEGDLDLSEFKELEESYKDNENKDIVLLQRARMLGVDISEDFLSKNEEWQTQINTMTYSKVFKLYNEAVPYTANEPMSLRDPWEMSLPDRFRLYKLWVITKKEKIANKSIDLVKEYKLIAQQKKEARAQKDIEILKTSKVIGMTTTGAAKNRNVLQEVGCPVVIIEEAAEVLEAHVITTMSTSCQHLILIGDHQQLRPNPTVHRLAVDFNLEISLFERMVNNDLPHITLQEQHRMRPEISDYLRYEYPHLIDHPRVHKYPDIQGPLSNVFFIQHSHSESDVEDTTSKANEHEAKFLVHLCNYFIMQEYESSQITILAAYSGQVQLIRSLATEVSEDTSKVRVSSIDNYQGEENDIILLSLVRSNQEDQVGFLKTHNRVCVAMSRAKMGLYVIGNLKMLESKSPYWSFIMKKARSSHVTGVSLPLRCVNHSHDSYITNPADFLTETPEGGCNKDCQEPLPCGHICPRKCHASDRFHTEFLCRQPCRKQCPEGHVCPKRCSDECGDCLVKVKKTIPFCGHEDEVECFLDPEEAICHQVCNVRLVCGHLCRGECGQCAVNGHHALCQENVTKEWPCRHINDTKCYVNTSEHLCPEKCREKLDCQHWCSGTCGGCLSGRVHQSCQKECGKPLPCGHPCKSKCGTPCQPCGLRCLTNCRHGQCSKDTCGEICDICTENCAMVCPHHACGNRCIDDCDTHPCNQSCKKLIDSCRHKCASLCGEKCVCRKCDISKFFLIDRSTSKGAKHKVAQYQQQKAQKFELSDDDLLMAIPKCKHVFTLRQLDDYVRKFDPKGSSYVKCPICPALLQGIMRYDTILKRRAERREALKGKLLKSTEVSKAKLSNLKVSKLMVGSFCIVDEGDFLRNKESQIDEHHAQALSLQIKFAFALKLMNDLHEEYNNELDFSVIKWKKCVQFIVSSISQQLVKEMKFELHRMVSLEEMASLNKVVKDAEVSVNKDLKSECKDLFKTFSKNKLTSDGKLKLEASIKGIYTLLDCPAASLYKKFTDDIRHRCTEIRRLIDSSDNQELCEIFPDKALEAQQRQSSLNSSDSEEESSFDEDESEEEI